jgi:predicted nucleic acid-binding protein
VSGDDDLLVLDRVSDISILSAAEFLARIERQQNEEDQE